MCVSACFSIVVVVGGGASVHRDQKRVLFPGSEVIGNREPLDA